MGWNEFGTALDDWIASEKELKRKNEALGVVDTLNKERNASDDYAQKKKRTNDWLASLTPEERSKLNPEVRNLPSTFEGVGDVSNFDFDRRANDMGLTSKYSDIEGVQSYLKGIEGLNAKKKQNEIAGALDTATTGLQRLNKDKADYETYKNTGDILSELNVTMPDTGESVPFDKNSISRLQSPYMQNAELRKQITSENDTGFLPLEFQKKGAGYSDLGNSLTNYDLQEPKTTPREVAINAGLPKYGSDEGVKAWYKTNVEDPEDREYKNSVLNSKGKDGYSAANNFGARKQWDNPEKKAATLEKLNKLKDYIGLDETTYGAYVNNINNGKAWDVSQAVDGLIAKKLGIDYDVDKAYKLIDPKAQGAAANTTASGNAEAFTPKFVAERQKEWNKTLSDYNEGYQQFALGKSAPDDGTGDVALINSLEKVRELNSAVMYGDYEKWNKATNFWQSLEQNGIVDASTSKLKNRLPHETRVQITKLLNEMYGNRKAVLTSARTAAVQAAKEDYGWNDQKANRIYRMPDLGFNAGYNEKNTQPKPVVTEPTQPKPLDSSKPGEPVKKPKFRIVNVQ